MKAILCTMMCVVLSANGKTAQGNSGAMKTTVAKVSPGLIASAVEHFKAGRDSLGAETSILLYDLDNEGNKEWLVKAGDGFLRAGLNDKAKKAFELYLVKHASRQVIAKLAAVEFAQKNYAKVVDLARQIPALVESLEALTMIVAESQFALGAFDEVLSLLPAAKLTKNRRGLELAAKSSEKMGDFRTALSSYEKLEPLAVAAHRQEISLTIATLYEKMGQKAKAVKAYEKYIIEYPQDLVSYERLSKMYMTDCLWRQAEALLEKAAAMPGAAPKLDRMLGQCLAAQANRGAAVNQYRQYLAKVPSDSAAWCELGSVYFDQEHYADAIEALKKSVAMMPKSNDCLTMLGESYMKNGDSRSAIGPLERSRQLVKSDIRVLSRLAECYRASGDRKKLFAVVKDWAMFDPKNGSAQNELAEMDIKDQKWRDAISALEISLVIDSTSAKAHLLFAKACEKTNNENGRIGHLKKAYQYEPDNADVLYELGALYAGRSQLSAARPLLAKAVSVDPMHANAQYEYGLLLRNSGERDAAYEHFNTAVQLEPFNTSFLVQFAQTAHMIGKKDVAFDYIKTALSRDSTSFELLQWAGIMYKEDGDVELARTLLLKAVVRNSSCASCYKYLADIYYDNGEYDLAVKFFNQSLSIGSYSEAASVGLGNALIMSGDFERAKMMYEKIFAGNTKGEETLYRLVSVYLRTGMLEKAKSLFAQYSAGRKSGWIQLALGEISEAQGSFSEALIAFTVAATLMPENPLAHSGAGRINLAKKEYDKAIEDFGRALGNAPHNVDFLIGMGKAYEAMGQLSAAFDLYAEVARKAPRQPDVFGLMGHVLSLQQLHDQAITVFRRGLELTPKNASLSYGLGRELRAMLQFNDAIEAFKKSVKTRDNEKQFFIAYKDIGDIYYYDLKNPEKAKDFYKKYMKFGGKDETVVSFVNAPRK